MTMMPKGMTLCGLVTANKQVFETKEIRIHEAWEEYRSFNTRTDENKDGQWKSQKTIHEKSIFFKPIVAKIGNLRVKDIRAEESYRNFGRKKSWS